MGAISGVTGTIAIPAGMGAASALVVVSWRATITRDIFDITSFANAFNAKESMAGMYDLKGTCEGFLGSAATLYATTAFTTADQAPVTGFVLTASTGRTFTFDGLISKFSPTVDKRGMNRFSLDFESSYTSGAPEVVIA